MMCKLRFSCYFVCALGTSADVPPFQIREGWEIARSLETVSRGNCLRAYASQDGYNVAFQECSTFETEGARWHFTGTVQMDQYEPEGDVYWHQLELLAPQESMRMCLDVETSRDGILKVGDKLTLSPCENRLYAEGGPVWRLSNTNTRLDHSLVVTNKQSNPGHWGDRRVHPTPLLGPLCVQPSQNREHAELGSCDCYFSSPWFLRCDDKLKWWPSCPPHSCWWCTQEDYPGGSRAVPCQRPAESAV